MFKNKICVKVLAVLGIFLSPMFGSEEQDHISTYQKEFGNFGNDDRNDLGVESPAYQEGTDVLLSDELSPDELSPYIQIDPKTKVLTIKEGAEKIPDGYFLTLPLNDFDSLWQFLQEARDYDFYNVGSNQLPTELQDLKEYLDVKKVVKIIKERADIEKSEDGRFNKGQALSALSDDLEKDLVKRYCKDQAQWNQILLAREPLYGDPETQAGMEKIAQQFQKYARWKDIKKIVFETKKNWIGKISESHQIKEIGRCAFAGCPCAIDLSSASELRKINDYAFSRCQISALPSKLSQMKVLGFHAFYQATIPSISFGPNLETIGEGGFEGAKLQSIAFAENPDANTSLKIKGKAFAGSSLMSIALPVNTKEIEASAFLACQNLVSIDLQKCMMLESIPEQFASGTSIAAIAIPENCKTIGAKAFLQCSKLQTLAFVKNVKLEKISELAFYEDRALKTIEFPNSIKTLGEAAFSDCKNLTNVSFGGQSSLKTIGANCFANTKLQYGQGKRGMAKAVPFVLPESVENIESGAFYKTLLSEITIPAKVKQLGYICSLEDREKKNEKGKTEKEGITRGVFMACSNLKAVKFASGSQIETIGENTFNETSIEEIRVPQTLKRIGYGAFLNLSTLKEVKFELSADSNFEGIEIDQQAFFGCSGLTKMVIPFCARLGKAAFSFCANLASVEFIHPLLKNLPHKCFSNCASLEIFSIPSSVETIEAQALEKTKIKHLYIPSNVKQLEPKTFFQNTNLLSLTFDPKSKVEKIPEQCCDGCVNLRHCVFSNQLKAIETEAFSRCKNLASRIFLPDSLEVLGDKAFRQCASIKSIVIGPQSQLRAMGDSCFERTSFFQFERQTENGFNLVPFPDGLKEAQDRAFLFTPFRSLSLSNGFQLNKTRQESTAETQRAKPVSSSLASAQQQNQSPRIMSPSHTDGIVLTKDNIDRYTYRDSSGKVLIIRKEVEEISERCFMSMPLKDLDAVWFFLEDALWHNFYGNSNKKFPPEIKALKEFVDLAKIISIMKINGWTDLNQFDLGKITDLNLHEFCDEWLTKNKMQDPFQTYQAEISTRGDPLNNWGSFVSQSLKHFVLQFLQGVEKIIFEKEEKNGASVQSNQIKKIGKLAFAGCSCVVDLTNAKALQEIDEYAFDVCEVIAKGQLPNIETIGLRAFYHSYISEMTVGAQLKLIDQSAFEDSLLQKMTFAKSFSENVTREGLTIEGLAFSGSLLNSIILPANTKQIKSNVFARCNELNAIDIQNCDLLKTIPAYFATGLKIKEIKIPQSVEKIEEFAFSSCDRLTRVSFTGQSRLKTIKAGAFEKNTALTTIMLPSSLTELGNSAFSCCTNLNTVSFELGSQLKKIGAHCFAYTDIQYSKQKEWFNPAVLFVLPDSVENIGEGAFYHCVKLTEIKLPSQVKYLGRCDDSNNDNEVLGVFMDCPVLTKVEFDADSQIESIGVKAFVRTNIETINFPKTLQKICCEAFFELDSLKNVRFEQNLDPEFPGITIDELAFSCCKGLQKMQIPRCSHLGHAAFAQCQNLQTILFEQPLFKDIPPQCFSKCYSLDRFEIPDSVETIGAQAFDHAKIRNLYIPSNVREIGQEAFSKNESLVSIVFDSESEIKNIPQRCFAECNGLMDMVLPKKLKTIGKGAFSHCSRLSPKIELPDSVETLEERAFFSCTSLKNIVTGKESLLKSIGKEAFAGTQLTGEFIFPETLNHIGAGCFANTSVDSIVINSNLQEIPERCFFNCPLQLIDLQRCGTTGLTIAETAFGGDSVQSNLQTSLTLECSHSLFVMWEQQRFFEGIKEKERSFGEQYLDSIYGVQKVYLCKESSLFSAHTPFTIKTYNDAIVAEENHPQLEPSTYDEAQLSDSLLAGCIISSLIE